VSTSTTEVAQTAGIHDSAMRLGERQTGTFVADSFPEAPGSVAWWFCLSWLWSCLPLQESPTATKTRTTSAQAVLFQVQEFIYSLTYSTIH
jgi:hypothetical protein